MWKTFFQCEGCKYLYFCGMDYGWRDDRDQPLAPVLKQYQSHLTRCKSFERQGKKVTEFLDTKLPEIHLGNGVKVYPYMPYAYTVIR